MSHLVPRPCEYEREAFLFGDPCCGCVEAWGGCEGYVLTGRVWEHDERWALTNKHLFGLAQRADIVEAAVAIDEACSVAESRLARMFAEWRPVVCGNFVTYDSPWRYMA